jgi:HAD superfamily hydrolase (TIGR01509 family)
VLVDSEALLKRAEVEALQAAGFTDVDEDACNRLFSGFAPEAGAVNFEKEYGRQLPEHFFRDQIANSQDLFREKLEALNGETVRALHAQGRQQVVASGSPRPRVDVCLEKAGISEIFQPDRVFTREDVERGKPEPDMFLKAAAFCGVAPSDCVVVEDSTAGIRAAAAAGMECVAYLGGGHARKSWYTEKIASFDCAIVYSSEELLEFLSEVSEE